MRVPLPVIAVAAVAVLAVGFVFLFVLLAAVRFFFATIELFGIVLLVAVIGFIAWKLFFEPDPETDKS